MTRKRHRPARPGTKPGFGRMALLAAAASLLLCSPLLAQPIGDGAEMGRDMAARLLARAGEGFFDWRA